MTTHLRAPIDSPAAWRGSDLRASSRWIYELEPRHREEIERAVRRAKEASKTLATLSRADFPLPTLTTELRRWSTALERELGFVLVRGFPTESLGDDAALAYFGLGLHLGTPVPQNRGADLLCHVRDHGIPRTGPEIRQYMTREKQDFHTDGADLIGLLCLRRAKAGGLSRIVSSVSVYSEIGRLRPELLPLLYEPMTFEGEFVFELPICSVHQGRLRMFYIGWYIRDAQRRPEVARLTPAQVDLLELIEGVANDPRFFLDMDFREGDIQLLNNASILHARTSYEDFEEPDRKRHLLRLWLTPHEFSSVEDGLAGGIPAANLVSR